MMRAIQVIASLVVAFTLNRAESAEILMQPIRASGAYTITGTEIRLSPGGQRVFLEVKIRDFAPHFLKTYQGQLDSTGYQSGIAGILKLAIEPCASQSGPGHLFCQTTFGDIGLGGSRCLDVDPGLSYTLQCEPAWMNRSRTDWVLYGHDLSAAGAEPLATANYRWAGGLNPGDPVIDVDGSTYYGGSLALDVPADAAGTFTIGFIPGAGVTFLSDEDNIEIHPLVLTSAKITILCLNDAQCDDLDECTLDHCDGQTQECLNKLIDADRCDDDNPCTVDECTPNGCLHSHYDGCSAIPALSEWGFVVMSLCLMIFGKIKFSIRSPRN